MTSPSRTYVFFLCCACIWCVLMFIPLAQVFHQPVISSIAIGVDRAFASICHQIDARSFHIMGIRLAVCGRCASIYAGFVAGIILWRIPVHRPPRDYVIWWMYALVPMLVDVFLEASGMYQGGNLTRALTGGWFGIIAGVIITPLFIQAWHELTSPDIHQLKRVYESATE